jgi:uncharacterized protein (TIGR03435 family)
MDKVDVHPSVHIWNPLVQGGRVRADRYELRQATVLDLIQFAYAVDRDTVFGGPSWLNWDRFDLATKS